MAKVLGIGFSSALYDDVNFEGMGRNLDQAAALGVDFVELPFLGLDIIAGGKAIPSQMRRLKAVLDGRPLRYTVHGPIAFNLFQPAAIVARHVGVLRAYMDAAAEIGAVHLIVHTGHMPGKHEAEIEAAYAGQREALATLGEHAAQAGLIVCVENIFVMNASDHTALPSRLAREIEAINHPHVRACLDFSHAAITCTAQGADFLSETRALAKMTRHLHLHDSFGDPTQFRTHQRSERVAYGLGDLHLPIGWGNIPWDAIMSSFTFEDSAIFNLELPPPYWYALEDCIASIRAMAAAYAGGSEDAQTYTSGLKFRPVPSRG